MKLRPFKWGGVFAALIVALASSALFAPSALAANYDLTVKSQQKGGTYQACQLFTGTATQGASGSTGELTGIAYGSALTGVDLTKLNGVGGLTGLTGTAGQTGATSAAELANKLSETSDAQAVAQKLAELKQGSCTTLTAGSETAAPYTFTANVAEGYYLVVQTAVSNPQAPDGDKTVNAVLSAPMLKVVGSTTIEAKDGVVKHDKEVGEAKANLDPQGDSVIWVKDADHAIDTSDYAIGSKVPFRLTGTLPANIDKYAAFSYKFQDVISKGFTIDKTSIKVTINGTEVDASLLNIGAEPTSQLTGNYEGGTALTVGFTNSTTVNGKTITSDIKAAAAANSTKITLTGNDTVVVTYTATLNGKANIGEPGNPNKSWIEYTKGQPGGEGTENDTTPPDETWTFTYKLTETKIDATSGDPITTGDAKFRLYTADKAKSATVDSTGKITGWVDGDGGTEVTVPANGKFSFAGLDAGTYYLRETKAPTGYNLPKDPDFKLVITAKITEEGGVGKITELKLEGGTAAMDGSTAAGEVTGEISNTSGSTLPVTGGIGTMIFTGIGLVVMATAGTALVARRRKMAQVDA